MYLNVIIYFQNKSDQDLDFTATEYNRSLEKASLNSPRQKYELFHKRGEEEETKDLSESEMNLSMAPLERPGEISPEGGEGDDEAHLHHGGRGGRPQSDVDTGGAGEETGEDLLDDDIAGQEHGDHDTEQ